MADDKHWKLTSYFINVKQYRKAYWMAERSICITWHTSSKLICIFPPWIPLIYKRKIRNNLQGHANSSICKLGVLMFQKLCSNYHHWSIFQSTLLETHCYVWNIPYWENIFLICFSFKGLDDLTEETEAGAENGDRGGEKTQDMVNGKITSKCPFQDGVCSHETTF